MPSVFSLGSRLMLKANRAFLIATALSIGVASPTAAADASLKVFEETIYYDVTGRSASELLSDMYEKGPDSLYYPGEALASTHAYFRMTPYFKSVDGDVRIRQRRSVIDAYLHRPPLGR